MAGGVAPGLLARPRADHRQLGGTDPRRPNHAQRRQKDPMAFRRSRSRTGPRVWSSNSQAPLRRDRPAHQRRRVFANDRAKHTGIAEAPTTPACGPLAGLRSLPFRGGHRPPRARCRKDQAMVPRPSLPRRSASRSPPGAGPSPSTNADPSGGACPVSGRRRPSPRSATKTTAPGPSISVIATPGGRDLRSRHQPAHRRNPRRDRPGPANVFWG